MDPNLNTNPNPAPQPAPTPAPQPEPLAAEPASTPAATPFGATQPEQTATPAPAHAPEPTINSFTAPQSAPQSTSQTAPAQFATANTPVATTASKGSSKKLITIIIIAVVLIALVILGIIFIPKLFANERAKEAKKVFSEDVYIAVEEGDKYGYIDLKGNMKIAPQFVEASDFEGDYAIAAIEKDGEKQTVVIDRKGQIKLTVEYNSSAYFYSKTNIWRIGNQLYDNKLKKILPDNQEIYDYSNGYFIVGPKIGTTDYNYESLDAPQSVELYNTKGKSIYSYQSKKIGIEVSSDNEAVGETYCALTTAEYETTVINCESGKVVGTQLPYELSNEEYTSFSKRTDEKYYAGYVVFANNEIIYETDSYSFYVRLYNSAEGIFYELDDDYENDTTKYYVFKSKKLNDNPPNQASIGNILSAYETHTGNTVIGCGSSYGLISGKTQVIPCVYQGISTPDILTYEYLKSKGKNYVIGNQKETSELINAKNGKVVTTFNYDDVDFNSTSTFITFKKDYSSDNYTVYNLLTGKTQIIHSSNLKAYPMYIRAYNSDEDSYDYYDKNLNKFYTEKN